MARRSRVNDGQKRRAIVLKHYGLRIDSSCGLRAALQVKDNDTMFHVSSDVLLEAVKLWQHWFPAF